MLFNSPEIVQAEIAYRQERIAEDFRKANGWRRVRRTATVARDDVPPEPVRVDFEPLAEADTHRPAA